MKKILIMIFAFMVVFLFSACKTVNNSSGINNSSATIQNDIESTSKTSKPTDNNKPAHTHTFSPATCTEPQICSCGKTGSSELGHKWTSATCTIAKTCTRCKITSGEALGHNYENGICKICKSNDDSYIQYTVVYNANGGWGETKSSSHLYNEARALSKNEFKRAGYTFIGWSVNSKATASEYKDTQIVKNLTKTDGDTITLYAVWNQCQTYAFEDLMPLDDSIDNIKFNQTKIDNAGQVHDNVAYLAFPGGYHSYSESERFTSGQFSKIKGTIIPVLGEYIREDSQTVIIIYANGNKVYESKEMNKYSSPENFEVDISGANTIKIKILDRKYMGPTGELMIENLLLTR